MLTSLRIQNFRSIRDASVKLGQVNLFIGPNNSGKSNFLKGMKLLAERLGIVPMRSLEAEQFMVLNGRGFAKDKPQLQNLIRFNLEFHDVPAASYARFQHTCSKSETNDFLFTNNDVSDSDKAVWNGNPVHGRDAFTVGQDLLKSFFKDVVIHKPDPTRFQLASSIQRVKKFDEDGQNILSFIYNLKENHRTLYERFEADFARCVVSLTRISVPLDPTSNNSVFRLKLSDQNDVGYWAEEVSEGVLYFLALLCIVHQPNPPKLLLLEEPEKGIHPRRIKEVMDFIFELAQLRGIQIILTSHSPYVVDHFADIPECVSIFDREVGETVIRNAADIIAETNDQLTAAGKPPIRFADGLGDYWFTGFLGGVPR